jgi:integrase
MAKKKPTEVSNGVKYTVDGYCTILRAAKRSELTVLGYRKILKSYADFLNVPLDEVHNHLSVSNLLKYADSRKAFSPSGIKNNLSVLHRYFSLNGVKFDELEYNAVKHKIVKEQNDKPLELASLQKMMDLSDPHGRALISFLVSTGCRAGETCSILLSDVNGDVVTIRNEIAKAGHGGKVYLTAEAREYLDLWLQDRDDYMRIADARTRPFVKKGTAPPRPVNDQRLFVSSYTSLHGIFSRLFDKVDGEKGKYHAMCTIHSCRKYFRTHAATTMHPDLVTGLMRQIGYLDSTYVRMTDDEKRVQFHAGEAALYITRADHRIQGSKLDALQRLNAALQERLKQVEQTPKETDSIIARLSKDIEVSKLNFEELKKDQIKMLEFFKQKIQKIPPL